MTYFLLVDSSNTELSPLSISRTFILIKTIIDFLKSGSSGRQELIAVRGEDEGPEGRGEDLRPLLRQSRHVHQEKEAGHPRGSTDEGET
jgi:hypothetical protein